MNPQTWWYAARSAGLVSWALCAASVVWGLALSTRAFGKRPAAPWLLDLHRFLGALSVVFVGVHVAGLVGDSYVHFGWADVLVPYASSWKPAATALGVVALWLLVAIELTSLAMRRLPKRVWHAVHLTSFGLYAFGTLHLLTAGTDATNAVVLVLVAVSVALVVFLTIFRTLAPRRSRAAARRVPSREAVARATATGG